MVTLFDKNTLDKDPDKDKGHKKVEKSDVMVYINTEDVYMNNVMDDIINTGMLNTKYEAHERGHHRRCHV